MKYDHFASLYDQLMVDAPYEAWLQYANRYLPKNGRVLDVACGTGTFTFMLAEYGYDMLGADLSQDMLTIAEEKARSKNANIDFYLQDMRELAGFDELAAVTIFCDGLNYLPSEADVQETFHRISKALKKGGVLLFDVHSPYKMEYIFNDQLYGENGNELTYMWFCEPGEAPLSVNHSLTFFTAKENGLYERIDEEQYQRTFLPGQYEKWLQLAGFHDVEMTSEFGRANVKDEDDRIFFKAIKK